MSAGGLLWAQIGWLVSQKRWMGLCWESLAALDPVWRVWVSPVPAGGPEHAIFHTPPFPTVKRINKSVLSLHTLLQTWAQAIPFCSRGAVGCLGCYSACCDGLRRDDPWVKVSPGTAALALWSVCIPCACCLCSLWGPAHILKTSGLDNPKIFPNALLISLSIL